MVEAMTGQLLEAALEYAAAGMPIFPCWPGTKVPACNNGFYEATTDVAQIEAWWSSNPEYNIGFAPDAVGWCVVDVEATAVPLWQCEDVPATYTIGSPRGGLHAYFIGRIPSKVKTLIPGAEIDTRGVGGYVLLPPSSFEGKQYHVLDDRPVADLPHWIQAACARQHAVVEGEAKGIQDRPSDVARARTHLLARLRTEGPPRHGERNATCFARACELRELGCSPATTFTLLNDILNQGHDPLDHSELEQVVVSAFKYGQNTEGIFATGSAVEVFGAALPAVIPKPKRPKFYVEDEDEMDVEIETSWLVPELLIEGTTAMLLGSTQSYKSFIATELALSVATGRETFAGRAKQGSVVYCALEGLQGVKGMRRKAWREARQIEGKIQNFFAVRAPMIVSPDEVQEWGDAVVKKVGKPKLVILDTLAKVAGGLNINNAEEAGRFVRFCESLVEEWGCTVLALHHIGKDADKGAMGSAALHAGFDTVLLAQADRASKLAELRVLKHKDAPEREEPYHLQGRAVGKSLVFDPVSVGEIMAKKRAADPFEPTKVGAALRKIGAVGEDKAVATEVLARELDPTPEGSENYLAHSLPTQKKLRALAKTTLAAYVRNSGAKMVWCLPN